MDTAADCRRAIERDVASRIPWCVRITAFPRGGFAAASTRPDRSGRANDIARGPANRVVTRACRSGRVLRKRLLADGYRPAVVGRRRLRGMASSTLRPSSRGGLAALPLAFTRRCVMTAISRLKGMASQVSGPYALCVVRRGFNSSWRKRKISRLATC